MFKVYLVISILFLFKLRNLFENSFSIITVVVNVGYSELGLCNL